MRVEDLRSLADRAESVRGRADQRLSEVHGRIASSRRRRAAGAVAGSTAVVLAVVLGVVLVTSPAGQRKSDGPPLPVSSETPVRAVVRKIVYSDDLAPVPHQGSTPLGRVGTIHVGDDEVRIDQVLRTVQGWALQVTDAGAVYAQDDQTVWLTDGGQPRRIADQACVDTTQSNGLATANGGSQVAWFDCSPSSQGAELVVFDTATGREVARLSVPRCRGRESAWPAYKCSPSKILGEHVYFEGSEGGEFVVDVTSGRLTRSTVESRAADIESHPRGFVVGDSWRSGQRISGLEQPFRVVGRRLVAELNVDSEPSLARATFDTATRRPVRFHLPNGYRPPRNPEASEPPVSFMLFEWLDDDTVALARDNARTHFGEVLVCRVSDGRCKVAVGAPAGSEEIRIVAGGPLPG